MNSRIEDLVDQTVNVDNLIEEIYPELTYWRNGVQMTIFEGCLEFGGRFFINSFDIFTILPSSIDENEERHQIRIAEDQSNAMVSGLIRNSKTSRSTENMVRDLEFTIMDGTIKMFKDNESLFLEETICEIVAAWATG